jgi:hypothetical protein
MHVVADASPLRYLILIGHIELLPTLFTQIIIPRAVLGELQRAQTPPVVRRWMQHLPVCCIVRTPQQPLATGKRCWVQGNVRPWHSPKSCTLIWCSSTKIKDAS